MTMNFLKWIGWTMLGACVAWLALYCLGTMAYYIVNGIVFGPSSNLPEMKP
jgi:hypothetical protein